jgi:MFS family permease
MTRSTAWRLVVLIGVVSLFADATYEGSRSIVGPYLGRLGAGALVVSSVAGLGELLGYALRFFFGALADRTGRYWALTLAGYAVNVLAVPALALTGRWETAAALIVLERAGKAARTPARDAILSFATRDQHLGRAFGIHEALDQVGATIGPLVVAAVLAADRGYQEAFGILLVPALLCLATLVVAWRLYPAPRHLEPSGPVIEGAGQLPRAFWLYLAGAAIMAAGYVDYPLIAFHLDRAGTLALSIPVLYSVAMASDAIAALLWGRLFDRVGFRALLAVPLVTAAFAPLVFLGGFTMAVAGVVVWGIGMGAQESVVRAAVARMAPAHRRATAYGTFSAGYGVAWFLGSVVLGFLYGRSPAAAAAFAAAAQLAALPFLFAVVRRTGGHNGR